MTDKDNKGSMTVAEAGRKGGETVRNERGREFYETIGRKGGATVKAERGRAFYEEIGRKGGETVKAERGAKFYEEIGKKGGDRVKATRGPNFYEEIGRKGGQKVKKLIEEGKRAARGAEKTDVVGAVRDVQLATRGSLDDRSGLEADLAIRIALLQDAQRLVRLAWLGEPNHHHVLFSHLSCIAVPGCSSRAPLGSAY